MEGIKTGGTEKSTTGRNYQVFLCQLYLKVYSHIGQIVGSYSLSIYFYSNTNVKALKYQSKGLNLGKP